jgi:hypothetical protein
MIDIFVVGILVSVVQLGNYMTITPGPGALAFAGVVMLTMLAAMSFEPRLLWDRLDDVRRPEPPTNHSGILSDQPTPPPAATPEIRRAQRWNIVWVVPHRRLLLGAWLLYRNFAAQGPVAHGSASKPPMASPPARPRSAAARSKSASSRM